MMNSCRSLRCKNATGGGICTPVSSNRDAANNHRGESLAEIVRCYIRKFRSAAQRELQFFADTATVAEAVRLAAFARTSQDRRHPHHQRRTQESLKQAYLALANCPVDECASFDELIEQVDEAIRHIHGIGELFVYDAALSIGARLGLEPKRIYLHAGKRAVARNLGLAYRRKSLNIEDLPPALQRLNSREIEDCLCIYKDRLRNFHW